MATPLDFQDVEIIERAALEPADRFRFLQPWIVQFPDATFAGCGSEESALSVQRHWRRCHDRDPETGELAR